MTTTSCTEIAADIAGDIRLGRKVRDSRLDQVYPAEVRSLSETHWTPIEVALRALELLNPSQGARLLDIGSGCGKFCVVAALVRSDLQVYGIEERPRLAEVAKRAASDLEARNVEFLTGNMSELDWSSFDSFYFFNPFHENRMRSIRIDDTISHNPTKFARYVEIVRAKLATLPPGTRVATYHGFGGDFPVGYAMRHREAVGQSIVEVWERLHFSS